MSAMDVYLLKRIDRRNAGSPYWRKRLWLSKMT